MLAKCHRLRSKDVRYIVKRRQYRNFGNFGFFWISQAHANQHRFAVHVGTNFSKKAVDRHYLKRLVMHVIVQNDLIVYPIGSMWYKFFVIINQQGVSAYTKLIASCSPNSIYPIVHDDLLQGFTALVRFLGKK